MLRAMRDLAGLAALSDEWVGGRTLHVAEGLADLLLRTLRLDFAYLRLYSGQVDRHEIEVARAIHQPTTESQTREFGKALAPWLDRAGSNEVQSMTNPLENGTVRVIAVPIGCDGEEGVLVAGSQQSGFPGEEDRSLLNFAAQQAATALRCRRAEEGLEQGRQRFQAVFENSLEGILLMDDAGRYVDGNPAICQLLGYSREELMRLTVWDVTPAPDRERIPDLLGLFLSAGTLRGEYTLLCKGGATREVEYRSVANILPGLHLGVLRDVTERKRSERELRDRHHLLHTVIEGIPEAIYIKDLHGRYLMMNSHGARLIGRAVDEVIGRDDTVLFDPETAQRIREIDRLVMESGESATHEQVGTAAGVTRTYLTSKAPFRNADGEVVGVLGISRDISESKSLQIERDRLLKRLRLQIDRLPLAYLLLDENHRVLDWNPAAEKTFGYTRAEALGRLCLDLIHPHEIDPEILEVLRRVESGDMRANNVNENRTKDGRVMTCHWFNTPLMDPDGNFAGVISLAQDITERKRAEEALGDSAARLQVLSRRVVEVQEEERRHLARELHDEIGQVLSTISVNLHAVKGVCGAATVSRIEESIHIVDQATQQVRNLSLDLRPSMLDDLGLVATLRWYADRQAQRAGIAVHFTAESSGDRLPAELTIACFRVVQESLTNVMRHARAQRVWVEFRQGDDEIELAVRDDGVGFDPETTRRSAARGESFGLVAIQERVELLGGRADIRSQPGHGTSIRVWFPMRSPPSAHDRSEGSQP